MRTQLVTMLGVGFVVLLLLVGCMDERDTSPEETDRCAGEADAGVEEDMSGPLFIKTPKLYADNATGTDPLELVTVPGPEAVLIETLHWAILSVLSATDAGKIVVLLTPPYPDDTPHVWKEFPVAANDPAVSGVTAQGSARLDLVLPEDWVLTVVSGVRAGGGGAWMDMEFIAQGGEVE